MGVVRTATTRRAIVAVVLAWLLASAGVLAALAATPMLGSLRVAGAGKLAGGDRTLAVSLTARPEGGGRGTLTFRDGAARFRMVATTIDGLAAAEGTATVDGTATVGGVAGHRFHLVLREAAAGRPAHVKLDVSGPKVARRTTSTRTCAAASSR